MTSCVGVQIIGIQTTKKKHILKTLLKISHFVYIYITVIREYLVNKIQLKNIVNYASTFFICLKWQTFNGPILSPNSLPLCYLQY